MEAKYVLFRSNFLFQILSKITGAYNLSLNQSKPETRIPSRYVTNNHVFLTSELLKTKHFGVRSCYLLIRNLRKLICKILQLLIISIIKSIKPIKGSKFSEDIIVFVTSFFKLLNEIIICEHSLCKEKKLMYSYSEDVTKTIISSEN